MLTVYVYVNSNNDVYSFKVNNHGRDIVCAAVSALVFNTINSIEAFTPESFNCDFHENGGFLFFELPTLKENKESKDAALLLNSFLLGVRGIKEDYSEDIELIINDEKIQHNKK